MCKDNIGLGLGLGLLSKTLGVLATSEEGGRGRVGDRATGTGRVRAVHDRARAGGGGGGGGGVMVVRVRFLPGMLPGGGK